jgi:hypothetical protein
MYDEVRAFLYLRVAFLRREGDRPRRSVFLMQMMIMLSAE